MEAESTKHYDFGIGTLALSSFVPLVLAQLLTAEGRYGEAVPIYSETLDQYKVENLKRREACFFGDRAWCYVNLGNPQAAMTDVRSAESAANSSSDIDDLASAHARIAAVLRACGHIAASDKHSELASQYLSRHQAAQEGLLEMLLANVPKP